MQALSLYAASPMSDSQIDALRADFERDLAAATTVAALRAVRDRYLARKGGLVSGLLKSLGSAPPMRGPGSASSPTISNSRSKRSSTSASPPPSSNGRRPVRSI